MVRVSASLHRGSSTCMHISKHRVTPCLRARMPVKLGHRVRTPGPSQCRACKTRWECHAVGDDFSRVTQVYRVTQYNIACCYSMLGQEESGLEALNAALASGRHAVACMHTRHSHENCKQHVRPSLLQALRTTTRCARTPT